MMRVVYQAMCLIMVCGMLATVAAVSTRQLSEREYFFSFISDVTTLSIDRFYTRLSSETSWARKLRLYSPPDKSESNRLNEEHSNSAYGLDIQYDGRARNLAVEFFDAFNTEKCGSKRCFNRIKSTNCPRYVISEFFDSQIFWFSNRIASVVAEKTLESIIIQ